MQAPPRYCDWPPLKRIYDTEAQANNAARRYNQRVYRCPHGDHWHLAHHTVKGKRSHRGRIRR